MMNNPIRFLALILLTLFLQASALPQTVGKQDKIKVFLNRYVEERRDLAQKGKALAVEFTDEFVTLPEDLEKSLALAFPNHKFVIAKMLYYHYTARPGAHLLLVADDETGEVTSFAWDLWFSGASESFRNILSQYQASSRKDALSKVKLLSSLLTFASNGRVGKVKSKNGIISSELFYKYSGDKEPWRKLRVSLSKEFRFGRIAFINLKDGTDDSALEIK